MTEFGALGRPGVTKDEVIEVLGQAQMALIAIPPGKGDDFDSRVNYRNCRKEFLNLYDSLLDAVTLAIDYLESCDA
jgi:hypothetical protein